MERRQGGKKTRKGRKNIFTAAVSWLVRWLLRTFHGFFLLRQSRAGFVMPTALMLLLVMGLVISSMLFRTSQRAQQVIGEGESQLIENAATPAIERAKSKIEYLFKSDSRLPSGMPSEALLETLMLNENDENDSANGITATDDDPYTLPHETRLNIPTDDSGNNYKKYNAWSFENGEETVIYSILMRGENDMGTADESDDITLEDADNKKKAYAQINRNSPLSINRGATSQDCNLELLEPKKGWYNLTGSSVSKNFQVNAVVVRNDDNTSNENVNTVEYHQDRQLDKGNKWGAWFLSDLGINRRKFNFNGALHTEASMMLGATGSYNNTTELFLVSSPNSCINSKEASEIRITEKAEESNGNNNTTYQGQWILLDLKNGKFGVHPHAANDYDRATLKVHIPTDITALRNFFINNIFDSIKDDSRFRSDYSPLILDPVALFTEDKFQALGFDGNGSTNMVGGAWPRGVPLGHSGALGHRVRIDKQVRRPFVDDTYRADNRWGPKTYNEENKVTSSNYGEVIDDVEKDLIEDDANTYSVKNLGLDGYWERRARAEGLRLIVGQRLELGNANGWGGSGNTNAEDDDPLYPYNVQSAASAATETTKNEDLQRRTLRDNLAAVQATAVYHYKEDDGYFPVTVLASTSHPGTSTTWTNSTTFDELDYITNPEKVDTDFLIGKGTNGWEFEPPAGNESTFETNYNNTNSDLRKALNNLAHFAGDSDGAFPPTQDTFGDTEAVVHPYPYLTMWGDFSNLRRIVDGSTGYRDLSIADKSTLHTAASALGMLAYNIENREGIIEKVATEENRDAGSTTIPNMQQLGAYLWELVDGTANASNPEIAEDGITNDSRTFDADYYYNFTPDQYIEAVKSLIDKQQSLTDNQKTAWKNYVETTGRQIWEANQINRDRAKGFAEDVNTIRASDGDLTWNTNNGTVTGVTGKRTACHPEEFEDFFPNTLPQQERRQGKVALALAFCDNKSYYPALYYLFPTADHNQGYDANSTEEYLKDIYIRDSTNNFQYKEVNLAEIALVPRLIANWKLPSSNSSNDDDSAVTTNKSLIKGSAVEGERYLAIQDKAFYDGRQLMQVHTLEINLDLLRKNPATNGDWWLPSSGIVYGFREDAVREDAIARPKNTNCTEFTHNDATSSNCVMNPRSDEPQDPPQNRDTGVSPKPVDYYPDPDRRPYGFRLKNGSVLYRGSTLNAADTVKAGMSFISDNPVYIQGDFNLHSTNGTKTTLIEEFDEKLENNWSNFYTRSHLNTNFARNDKDTWRPTEVSGDALTVLSNNFCDGYTEDGLVLNDTACPNVADSKSSYLNSTLAKEDPGNATGDDFVREENSNTDSPIRVDRNGDIYSGNSKFSGYRSRNPEPPDEERRILGQANETIVNAALIGGISPNRYNQYNGGLTDYIRKIEHWSRPLNIQGSFLQINFSTYATAPFDQDAWNVSTINTDNTQDALNAAYYQETSTGRKWGYDVALQYRPPAPITARFNVFYGSPRNESYQDLVQEDPYNQLLFCAKKPEESQEIEGTLCKLQDGGDENGN